MDAVVMCGGEGERLHSAREKPLYEIARQPMVAYVLTALAGSAVEDIHAAVSPDTPATQEFLEEWNQRTDDPSRSVAVIETPGDGYVPDLQAALDSLSRPVLTVAADLPLLTADAVDTVLEEAAGQTTTVCVPSRRKEELGVSADTTFTYGGESVAPAGINVVGPAEDEQIWITEDGRFAVNVNYPGDALIAEKYLLEGRDG